MHRLKPCLVLVLGAALAACGSPEGEDAASSGALDSPVVATVNGEAVPAALVDAYLRARGPGADATPEQRRQALQEIVNLVLLRQQAEKQKLDENPDVKADLALHRLSTLATRQVRAHNQENPVTEADARAEYEKNRQAAGGKEYHVRHILLDSRQAAEQAIVDLNEGADFADMADERSLDTRKDAGGDLGWLNLAQLPEPLREPVRGLRAGAHSQAPVQTRYGWHVLKLVETRSLEPPAYDQVKQGVIASLQRQRTERYVESLRADANIKVTPEFATNQPAAPGQQPAAAPAEDDQGG